MSRHRLNLVSKINHYRCSDGTKVTQTQINARVKQAKQAKFEKMLDDEPYYHHCEDCGLNKGGGQPLDMSHDVSMLEAKATGQTELCWDVDNLTMRCRPCHRTHDNS